MSSTDSKVIKIVQELLLDEMDEALVTPSRIAEKIDLALSLNPKWREEFDRQAATDELVRRFSLWIGQDVALQSNEGHRDWLSAGRKRDWKYWQRFRDWQERDLSIRSLDALDRSTDSVLSLLEDPLREGPWDRRGLVVGHVQSGKTGHYSGLICQSRGRRLQDNHRPGRPAQQFARTDTGATRRSVPWFQDQRY